MRSKNIKVRSKSYNPKSEIRMERDQMIEKVRKMNNWELGDAMEECSYDSQKPYSSISQWCSAVEDEEEKRFEFETKNKDYVFSKYVKRYKSCSKNPKLDRKNTVGCLVVDEKPRGRK